MNANQREIIFKYEVCCIVGAEMNVFFSEDEHYNVVKAAVEEE